MKRGDMRTINIEGNPLLVEYLGKGHYCTAWRHKNNVFLFVKGDYLKEPLLSLQGMKHIPKLEQLESSNDALIYKTLFYPNITAKDKKAWGHYKSLSEALENARKQIQEKHGWQRLQSYGHEINNFVAEQFSGSLGTALKELVYEACNYGSGVTFEFAPRNLGVDSKGNLVLRDVLFDAEKIFEEREKMRAKKSRFA